MLAFFLFSQVQCQKKGYQRLGRSRRAGRKKRIRHLEEAACGRKVDIHRRKKSQECQQAAQSEKQIH